MNSSTLSPFAILTFGALLSACSGEPSSDDGGPSTGGTRAPGSGGNDGGGGGAGDGPGGASSSGGQSGASGGAAGDTGAGGDDSGSGGGDSGSGGSGGGGDGPCPAGSYLEEADSPASCTACPSETFSTAADSLMCSPWTVCAGWSFSEDGSSTSDTSCSSGPVRQFGTSVNDLGLGVAVDSAQNVYVVGQTTGSFAGEPRTGPAHADAFLRKFDARGRVVWMRQFGTPGQDSAYGVAVAPNGDVVVVGSIAPQPVDNGHSDAFARKFDANGEVLWNHQFGTPSSDTAYGVAIDAQGNVFVAGQTSGSLEGTSAGGQDAFLRKLSSSGVELWTQQWGTSQSDAAHAVAIDSNGNPLVTGEVAGLLGQAYAGSQDGYIRKFDADGLVLWTHQFGTAARDVSSAIALGADGSIFVAGETHGVLGASSAGASDPFVYKTSSTGELVWVSQIGTEASDIASAVLVNSSGRVIVAGTTTDSGSTYPERGWLMGLDASGERQWKAVMTFFGERDRFAGIALGASDRIFAVGSTAGDLGQTNAGQFDAFVFNFEED